METTVQKDEEPQEKRGNQREEAGQGVPEVARTKEEGSVRIKAREGPGISRMETLSRIGDNCCKYFKQCVAGQRPWFESKEGTTRRVVLFLGLAFKFPTNIEWRLFLCGLLCNIQEVEFSKTNDRRLCPILFSLWGGWLVVMPQLEYMDREQFLRFDYEAWIKDGTYTPPVENKWDSFGVFWGDIVAIDYGSGN